MILGFFFFLYLEKSKLKTLARRGKGRGGGEPSTVAELVEPEAAQLGPKCVGSGLMQTRLRLVLVPGFQPHRPENTPRTQMGRVLMSQTRLRWALVLVRFSY